MRNICEDNLSQMVMQYGNFEKRRRDTRHDQPVYLSRLHLMPDIASDWGRRSFQAEGARRTPIICDSGGLACAISKKIWMREELGQLPRSRLSCDSNTSFNQIVHKCHNFSNIITDGKISVLPPRC